MNPDKNKKNEDSEKISSPTVSSDEDDMLEYRFTNWRKEQVLATKYYRQFRKRLAVDNFSGKKFQTYKKVKISDSSSSKDEQENKKSENDTDKEKKADEDNEKKADEDNEKKSKENDGGDDDTENSEESIIDVTSV